MAEVEFKLPIDPEEFGVKLPTASLRRIDFTALEYDTLMRSCIEYIKAYYPDQFNDFVDNNGIIMLLDLLSYIASTIAERGEVLVQESFLPTAFSEEAVSNHISLIDEKFQLPTPAVVDVECSVTSSLPTTLNIPAGLKFNLTGADGNPMTYELYRAPDNWSDTIQILPGKRGVVAFGIEGQFETPYTAISSGGPNQTLDIINDNILDDPIFTSITSGSGVSTRWTRVDAVERSGPNDEVFEVARIEGGIRIKFGDDVAGKTPKSGEIISVEYRVGGGSRGRIGSNIINETRSFVLESPVSAPIEVQFRNIKPSSGGDDSESIDAAKKRAPREAATLNAAVSGTDYAELATDFSHPVFGSVLKAIATVRTSLNANIVEIYALAEGSELPVTPSSGLKKGLKTYLEDINALTDEVRVLDGAIKRVKLTANVVMDNGADAPRVKSQVETAINNFFDISNFDMGQELYLSDIYDTIKAVDGVRFVSIFDPTDDILNTGNLADPSAFGVGMNELIVLGETQLQFYFNR